MGQKGKGIAAPAVRATTATATAKATATTTANFKELQSYWRRRFAAVIVVAIAFAQ